MNLTTKIAHESNYTRGRISKIEYLVIHYTGNDGDTGAGNANYFSKPNRNASAHYFVDENSITQTVKDSDTAWHCGTNGSYFHTYCRNSNSIGIELCSEKNRQAGNNKYYFNEATIKNAVELVKLLMEKYSIPIENVIRHYDVTHKICPEPFVNVPESWNNFKNMIKKKETNKLTYDEAKQVVKEKLNFDDNTMNFLNCYKYAESLFIRIAEQLK